jgi:hypothetical protein
MLAYMRAAGEIEAAARRAAERPGRR